MERPVWKPPGTPAEELDTPALVVDRAAMDRNIETLHGFFRDWPAKVRPYVEAHRCPAIAHRQLAAGGTVGGILVSNLGQAEVFAQQGFGDIAIAMPIVAPQKINRLRHLAGLVKLTVSVDSAQNIHDLEGSNVDVLVALRASPNEWGVEPESAVQLARLISATPGLDFAGVGAGCPGSVVGEGTSPLQQLLATREAIEKEGIAVRVVRAGNTRDYQTAGATPGVTEVPAGAYVLSDARHKDLFPPAAKVLATVISRPEPGLALLDLGQKAITADTGWPLAGLPGARITRQSAEHGFLELDGAAMDLGDKIWAVPHDIGNCANVYDYINVVSDGRLEAVWPVAARGHYR